MDFTANYGMFLTEEHDILRKTVRDFAEKEVAPHIREWDRSGAEHGEGPEIRSHIKPVLQRMGELGLLGICTVSYTHLNCMGVALRAVCQQNDQ